MPGRLALLSMASVIVASSVASAQEGSRSRSVGATNRGRLQNGVRLTETPHVKLQPGDGAVFGTAELVSMIQRAAERVDAEDEGPPLLVGALSRRSGGRIRPHSSHQNGRDADIGFYLTDEDGRPADADRFVRLDEGACGRDRDNAYCLDGARTFRFIAALLEDPVARVQFVLVAADLREQILAAGRRMGAPAAMRERVELVTEIRGGSEAHRSHLHVRIYCPVDDRPRCHDGAPFHEWYEGEPPRARPGRAARRRARQRARQRARRRAARRRAR